MPSSIFSSEIARRDAGAPAFTRGFLLVFLLLFLGLSVVTEIIIRVHVIPNHNFYRYAALFREAEAETAIFGDSQVAYGIADAPNTVNLAYGGDDFKNIADRIRLYLERPRRPPKRLILQAGLHHFSYQYVWRVGRDDSFLERIGDARPSFPALLHPVHRREIFNYWETLLKGADFVPRTRLQADGAQLVQGTMANVPESSRHQGAARLATELAPTVPPSANWVADLYRDTVRELRGQNIGVCLVSMPVSPPLMRAMQEHPSFDEARAFFQSVARLNGIRYIDYSRMALDLDLFADLNHLNARGARYIGARALDDCFPAKG